MNGNPLRRLLSAMLWIDLVILVATPLWFRAAAPVDRPELLRSLVALAFVALFSALLLWARPPP